MTIDTMPRSASRAPDAARKIKVVDADTHFWQPIEIWRDYIDPALRQRIIDARLALEPPLRPSPAGAPQIPDKTPEGLPNFINGRQGGGDRLPARMRIRGGDHADARIEWMDSEGIDACIIYPTFSAGLAFHPDPDIAAASCRALNRWSADFASYSPGRLRPCMILPWYEPERALEELEVALSLGLKAAFATPTPSVARRWSNRSYDPLWKALQDAGVVMTYHEFTRIPGKDNNIIGREEYKDVYAMMYLCGHTLEAALTLMDLMYGGVFSRFPKLKIGFVEAHVAWLPGWLAMLDLQWRRAISSFNDLGDWGDVKLTPTELFRRQGFIVAFPDDNWVRETIAHVGEDAVMLCTDYPHPATRNDMVKTFQANHADLSDVQRRKVMGENAARIFGLQ